MLEVQQMTDNKTTRVNFNATPQQKRELVKLAKKQNMTLTDFIIRKCLEPLPTNDQETALLELKLQHANEKLETLQNDHRELKRSHEDLKQLYQVTHNAMLWHTLPFYKKIGKRLELPNKEVK